MLKDYIKIIFISVIYRLMMLLGNWKNTFIGTKIPYPLQPDGYYYYHILNLPKIIIFLIPIISLCIGLIFFYETMKLYFNKDKAFLGTISLSLFFPFFIQTYISYTDTPSIIFMFTIIISYLTIQAIRNRKKIPFNVSMIILNILLLALFWVGWKIIAIVVLFSIFPILLYETKYKKTLLLLSGSCFTFVLIKLLPRFIEFLKLFNTINELRPNWNPIWLIFNIFIFIILFDTIKTTKTHWEFKLSKDKFFILIMALTFTILSMLMCRWTYLAMPFIIIIIFIWLKNDKALKIFIITILLLSILNTIIVFISIEPLMDNETQLTLESLENKQIICNWGKGHVYNMFTISDVKNKAHPKDFDRWMYGLQNDTNIFKNMTTGYIILSNWDIERLNNTMNYTLINKTKLIEIYEVN